MQDKKKISKKHWGITSKEGKRMNFLPIFEANEEGEIETLFVKQYFTDEKGVEHDFTFNWLDIYMFVYFVANEELRQQLAARYERKVNYIPYDVTFTLDAEEKAKGMAKRRIELPVDEVTMAIARNEAWKLWIKSKTKDNPKAFFYKNNRK